MKENVIKLMPPEAVREANRALRAFERGDQVELAQALIERLREKGQIVFDDGALYRYSAKHHVFELVPEAEQSVIVQSFAGAPTGEKGKPLALKRADVMGAIRLAWDVVSDVGFFANTPTGLVFADAFVEATPSGCIKKTHSIEHRARFAYPFEFVELALPARLVEFLNGVFKGDPDANEKIRLLQEYMGVALLGAATKFQRVLVLFGPGANGKGVFMTIAEASMPKGSSCAIAPQDWGDEYRLAMLAGKRLNIVSELPEADILETESFKAIVAGDSMTGRHIRQAPFTFRPVAGHIFSGNRLPGTNDQTHGFWRRILVAQFNRVFAITEQDSKLAEKIIAGELPSIVSWFLDGAARVFSQGSYTIPPSSAAAVEKWKRHADQVRAFVDEWTTKLALDSRTATWTKAGDVYRAYRSWANDNGHRPVASNTFGVRMDHLGLPSRHTEDGNRYPVKLATRLGQEPT